MVFKRNGMRAAVGAAAMAMVLVGGSPVQAKMYKFTVTGVQQDGSAITGSVDVDSSPKLSRSGNNDWYGNYSYSTYNIANGSGLFSQVFSGTDGSGHEFFWQAIERNLPSGVRLGVSSLETIENRVYHAFSIITGSYDPALLFTSDALTSGLYNEFNYGTYALSNPEGNSGTYSYDLPNYDNGSSTGGPLNLASLSLRIGPAAPAPLVGGGLLSALAALLGLGMTRLGRRRDVLA